MAIIDLPILPLETSVSDAGESMLSNGVSAVVAMQNDRHFIITADDMHHAIVRLGDLQGLMTLDAVSGKNEAASHLTSGPTGIVIASIRPPAAPMFSLALNEDRLRSLVPREPGHFSILERTAAVARVVTFDDTFEMAINRTITRGRCRDPQHHRWYEYQLINNPYCNLDPTVVDF